MTWQAENRFHSMLWSQQSAISAVTLAGESVSDPTTTELASQDVSSLLSHSDIGGLRTSEIQLKKGLLGSPIHRLGSFLAHC
jgi:hypothetical protein